MNSDNSNPPGIPIDGPDPSGPQRVPIQSTPQAMLLAALATSLSAWQAARRSCADRDLSSIGARFATDLGLPALASVFDALDRLERGGGGYVARDEMLHVLSRILAVALGEAKARVSLVLGEDAMVPGAHQVVRNVLEAWLKTGVAS